MGLWVQIPLRLLKSNSMYLLEIIESMKTTSIVCNSCGQITQYPSGCDFCLLNIYYCPSCILIYDDRGLSCSKHFLLLKR